MWVRLSGSRIGSNPIDQNIRAGEFHFSIPGDFYPSIDTGFEFRLEEGLLALQQELRGSGYAIILPHTSCRQAVRVG